LGITGRCESRNDSRKVRDRDSLTYNKRNKPDRVGSRSTTILGDTFNRQIPVTYDMSSGGTAIQITEHRVQGGTDRQAGLAISDR